MKVKMNLLTRWANQADTTVAQMASEILSEGIAHEFMSGVERKLNKILSQDKDQDEIDQESDAYLEEAENAFRAQLGI